MIKLNYSDRKFVLELLQRHEAVCKAIDYLMAHGLDQRYFFGGEGSELTSNSRVRLSYNVTKMALYAEKDTLEADLKKWSIELIPGV